jgi:hypothetical protein
MHSRTTAREILADFEGEPLDYWVTGFGTGGTLKGVARVLAKERPATKIIVCEPVDAPMLTSAAPQERNPDGSAVTAHVAWKPHPMQGWSPDFTPKLTGDAVAMQVIDRVLTISSADAMHCSRQLAQKEGIFVGITAGATFAGALEVCRDAAKGATVLCMLPDTGERYLSTPLFADIPADRPRKSWKFRVRRLLRGWKRDQPRPAAARRRRLRSPRGQHHSGIPARVSPSATRSSVGCEKTSAEMIFDMVRSGYSSSSRVILLDLASRCERRGDHFDRHSQ